MSGNSQKTMSETRQFAYGHWTVSDMACPISAAGLQGDGWSTEVAEDFDALVTSLLDLNDAEGVITKEEAKEVWQKLKKLEEANAKEPADEAHKHMHERKLELIEDVEELVFDD